MIQILVCVPRAFGSRLSPDFESFPRCLMIHYGLMRIPQVQHGPTVKTRQASVIQKARQMQMQVPIADVFSNVVIL